MQEDSDSSSDGSGDSAVNREEDEVAEVLTGVVLDDDVYEGV